MSRAMPERAARARVLRHRVSNFRRPPPHGPRGATTAAGATPRGRHARRHGIARPSSRGFSLVELLVSLLIGVGVVGALLAAWLAVGQSTRHADALNQMSEDGTLALQLLRQHVAMAGYRSPPAGEASFTPLKPALFGCDGGSGFIAGTAAPIDALGGCVGGHAGPDWLAVSYQVDVDAGGAGPRANAVLRSGGAPVDCIGNTLARTGSAWVADAHFYVARPTTSNRTALYCRQGGTSSSVPAQPLVENVVDFQVRYLLAVPGVPRQGAWYSDAPDTHPGPASRFDDVVAVRLCVEVTSTTPVADRRIPQPYLDCAERPVVATDGYLHRAFATTVALSNRL